MTDILPEVSSLAELLRERGWKLVTAESCTGGLIAGACTEMAGSSDWFDHGLVSYSNSAKVRLLGVDPALIQQHGAVSEPVAEAMARGALAETGAPPTAQVALSVTGVAGPGGGSADKPVGTVCFGWALPGRVWTQRRHFSGDRAAVRQQTLRHSLQQLLQALRDSPA